MKVKEMYGSVMNRLMENSKVEDEEITIGMGATILMWSDRHAATVIDISDSGKTVTIQRDKAIRTDDLGMSDSQSYTYEPDPNGVKSKIRKNKHGQWKEAGKHGNIVHLGHRQEYYDYSF